MSATTLRMGIIGVGNMGSLHARSILDGKVDRLELVAIADTDPHRLVPFEENKEVRRFDSAAALLEADGIDAVLIATPHYDHTTIGIAALEKGFHVLTEKPISVHKADCERLIGAYTDPGKTFAAMFNQRTDPYFLTLRKMIRDGELGKLQRIHWIMTDWFRTERYYTSGGWRATWKGEGGGVLLNQCPHQLDLWQWLFGMPDTVRAFVKIGQFHDIEVEDNVTAYLEYANGASGVFTTTTGEAPGTNRLEVAGDRAKVVIENDRFRIIRNEVPASEFSRTSEDSFDTPPRKEEDISIDGHGEQHVGILKNFTAAILDNAELLAPAVEGIHSVELGNAMLQSGLEERNIALPLDAQAYEQLLMEKIKTSTFEKKTVKKTTSTDDFLKSF